MEYISICLIHPIIYISSKVIISLILRISFVYFTIMFIDKLNYE